MDADPLGRPDPLETEPLDADPPDADPPRQTPRQTPLDADPPLGRPPGIRQQAAVCTLLECIIVSNKYIVGHGISEEMLF